MKRREVRVRSCPVSTKLGWRKVNVTYLGELHFDWGEDDGGGQVYKPMQSSR